MTAQPASWADIEPRMVRELGPAERNAIWECDGPRGPRWHAFYAWFGTEAGGWHYTTPNRAAWSITSAGLRDVTAATITSGTDPDPRLFEFQERARFTYGGGYLFTASGDAIPIPNTMTSGPIR